jgi:N-acetylglucosaminyl-diphospho-decaprenol L-rhamnosyltransferase
LKNALATNRAYRVIEFARLELEPLCNFGLSAKIMTDAAVKIAAVIVNFRTPELVLRCLSALSGERKRLPYLHVVVVDGGSMDGSVDKLSLALRDPLFSDWVSLLPLPINGGFGWANNQAILQLLLHAQPPAYIYMINPDAEIKSGALTALLDEMARYPKAAACGSRLLDHNGRILGAAFRFPSPLREFSRGLRTAGLSRVLGIKDGMIATDTASDVDWVTGASMLLRSAALHEVGLFDDGFFLYFEEVELMWRLRRAGWNIRHVPASCVTHVGGAATGFGIEDDRIPRRMPDYWYRSRRRFFSLCYGRLATVLAGTGWLLGHVLWLIRAMLEHRVDRVPHEGRDFLRLGFVPVNEDFRRSVTTVTSFRSSEPAWMKFGQ